MHGLALDSTLKVELVVTLRWLNLGLHPGPGFGFGLDNNGIGLSRF